MGYEYINERIVADQITTGETDSCDRMRVAVQACVELGELALRREGRGNGHLLLTMWNPVYQSLALRWPGITQVAVGKKILWVPANTRGEGYAARLWISGAWRECWMAASLWVDEVIVTAVTAGAAGAGANSIPNDVLAQYHIIVPPDGFDNNESAVYAQLRADGMDSADAWTGAKAAMVGMITC